MQGPHRGLLKKPSSLGIDHCDQNRMRLVGTGRDLSLRWNPDRGGGLPEKPPCQGVEGTPLSTGKATPPTPPCQGGKRNKSPAPREAFFIRPLVRRVRKGSARRRWRVLLFLTSLTRGVGGLPLSPVKGGVDSKFLSVKSDLRRSRIPAFSTILHEGSIFLSQPSTQKRPAARAGRFMCGESVSRLSV